MSSHCRECRQNFGSTSAYDNHRTGNHTYTHKEGLNQNPPVEDGRRCYGTDELENAGWTTDSRGCWRQPSTDHTRARLATLRMET